MILYFTGTGNAKYIAEKIANVTGDETKNIVAYTRDNEKFLQGDGERLVLVSPVYYWGIPESVKGFLKTLKTEGRYFAIVLECGGSTGNAQGVCERYVRPDAVFGVVAVDNFCPMFKIESAEVALAMLAFLSWIFLMFHTVHHLCAPAQGGRFCWSSLLFFALSLGVSAVLCGFILEFALEAVSITSPLFNQFMSPSGYRTYGW